MADSNSNSPPPTNLAGGSTYPKSRIALFALTAVAGCVADLATKGWVFAQKELLQGDIWWWVPDYVGIQLSLNEGALFGMGQGLVWMFALFSLVAAIAIPTWLFRYGAAADAGLTLSLGCVMAGVLGNLYDRLGLHGLRWRDPERLGQTAYAVRDWILLQWGPEYHWPNFNLADALLVCGAGYLMLKALFEKPSKERP